MIRGPGAASEFASGRDAAPAASPDARSVDLLQIGVSVPLLNEGFSVLAVSVLAGIIAGTAVIAARFGKLGGPLYVLIGFIVALYLLLLRWLRNRQSTIARRELAAGGADLSAALLRAASKRSLDGRSTLKGLAAQLAADGRLGLAVRFTDAESTPLRAMEQPFEPEPLGQVRSVAAWLSGNDPAADEGIRRTMWRNVRMKGGWAIVAIFVVNLLLAMFESWRSQRLTFALLAWSLALAALFLAPVLWSGAGQWLVAPAALIHRPRGWTWQTLAPRLFANRTSVLLTGCVHRQLWGFAVSDGRKTESGYGTREDMDALLSAWLSPLPPPEPGRISDLE